MYQGFKQECPTGIVTEDTFKDIFAQFFPQGDSTQYAHYVFKSFKQTYGGTINFEQFLNILSLLSRGTVSDKLQWIFGLYDINGDGYITKQEMLNIVSAIYDMLGQSTDPAVTEDTANEHVERIFHLIDSKQDGVVTLDEFMEWCQNENMASESNYTLSSAVESIDVPKDIKFNSHVIAFAFHPGRDILAAGLIDGPVKIWSYTTDSLQANHKLMSFSHYRKCCRAVHFSAAGDTLFTGSSDKTALVVDLNEGAISRRLISQEGAAIYSMLPIDNYLLATGDDDGQVALWDFRRELPVMTAKVCEDYVSDFKTNHDKKILLCTSGGGILSVFNLRSRKMEHQSEPLTNELLSVSIMKQETKVVAGDGCGGLNIFNWGEWSNFCDKFAGDPVALHSMVSVNDDILCIGCEQGEIEVVEICPNHKCGTLAKHDNFPVEILHISHDNKFIASSSYDQKIKFHDLSTLKNINSEKDAGKKAGNSFKSNNFFSDMA